MTSGTPFPSHLTEIDELVCSDHYYLETGDKCYFLGEYTARKGFTFSETNRLVLNLKKPMDRRNKLEWKYKEKAIKEAGAAFGKAIPTQWLDRAVFVPIPPSRARHDPMYDNRMSRVIAAIRPSNPVMYRELILQKESTEATHGSSNRPNPQEIGEFYILDESLIMPQPNHIVLCDDVLTTGAHFKAAQKILGDLFPRSTIYGCFIARRIPQSVDFIELFKTT